MIRTMFFAVLLTLPLAASSVRIIQTNSAGDDVSIIDPAANKVSLAFSVENRPGSLVAALAALSSMNTNLTKIESRPVHGKPWEYVFYVDCQVHSEKEGSRALEALKPHCAMVKELGRYREAHR